MPTFSNDVNGNIPLYYIPITLSSNGGSGFQQQITIDSNSYSSYLATDISNLNFQDGSGNILKSWLESGETNTSTASIYWVQIPNSTITEIYAVLYSTSAVSKDSTTTGCEPNYTSTYGQYDNGANVFTFYDNFAGTTLNTSKWISAVGSGTITVNNGVQLSTSTATGYANIYYKNAFSTDNTIREALINVYGSSGTDIRDRVSPFYTDAGTATPSIGYGFSDQDFGYMSGTGGFFYAWNDAFSSVSVPVSSSASVYNLIDSQEFTNTGNFYWNSYNLLYSPYYSNSGTFTAGSSLNYAGYAATLDPSQTGTSELNIQWTRTRAYPPNGVMPTTTLGNITEIGSLRLFLSLGIGT